MSAPFPDSYTNDFEAAALNSEAPYLSDQAGKWEVRAEKATLNPPSSLGTEASSKPNQVLSQVCVEQGVVYRASLYNSLCRKSQFSQPSPTAYLLPAVISIALSLAA